MESFVAMSRRDLPSSILSNTLTPPPLAPPVIKYLSSGPPNVIPRRCFRPVLISAMSSRLSGFCIEKIDMMSPSGDGSLRFERYK